MRTIWRQADRFRHETRAYVAAIAPLIGEGRIEDAMASRFGRAFLDRRRRSLSDRTKSAPTVDQCVGIRCGRTVRRSARRVVDVSALVPRSDSLFVRVSARERPR